MVVFLDFQETFAFLEVQPLVLATGCKVRQVPRDRRTILHAGHEEAAVT